MIKQILILLILTVTCFWGKASNNDNDDFHGDIQSPAVRNCLKFNYDQLSVADDLVLTNFSDDFNLPHLRSLWHSTVNERDWTLKERPGFLRIRAQKISSINEYSQENSISQRVKYNTSGEAVSNIDLSNLSDDSNAGLYFCSKRMNYIGIQTNGGIKQIVVSINDIVFTGPVISESSVILRMKIENASGWFEYSCDGFQYEKLGPEFKISALSTNDNIGLYCYNIKNESGSIDIDWFYFNPRIDNTIKFAENKNEILYPEL